MVIGCGVGLGVGVAIGVGVGVGVGVGLGPGFGFDVGEVGSCVAGPPTGEGAPGFSNTIAENRPPLEGLA